jgi:hypothetical protein
MVGVVIVSILNIIILYTITVDVSFCFT